MQNHQVGSGERENEEKHERQNGKTKRVKGMIEKQAGILSRQLYPM